MTPDEKALSTMQDIPRAEKIYKDISALPADQRQTAYQKLVSLGIATPTITKYIQSLMKGETP